MAVSCKVRGLAGDRHCAYVEAVPALPVLLVLAQPVQIAFFCGPPKRTEEVWLCDIGAGVRPLALHPSGPVIHAVVPRIIDAGAFGIQVAGNSSILKCVEPNIRSRPGRQRCLALAVGHLRSNSLSAAEQA